MTTRGGARCGTLSATAFRGGDGWTATSWTWPLRVFARAAIRMEKNICVSVPDVKRILKQGGDSGVRKDGRSDRKGS